jgi:hypothetical protein
VGEPSSAQQQATHRIAIIHKAAQYPSRQVW